MFSGKPSELKLLGYQKKTIVSIEQSLNQNGGVIELIIVLDDGKEIYISSDNNDALLISLD